MHCAVIHHRRRSARVIWNFKAMGSCLAWILENVPDLSHHDGIMVTLPLQPESEFSRAVFKVIRPHIPRERWPVDSVLGRFQAGDDGMWLSADFDDFPRSYAVLAAQLVQQAGVDLVLKSPMALAAAAVVAVKRWRDAALYAFLPLMFAIPLMAALSDAAMRSAVLFFCVDLVALVIFQALLVGKRAKLAEGRFIAHIPAPGLKIHLGGRQEGPLGSEPMPEV
ncbi:MAG TPA: hypothetical protein VK196_04635 [Magnetospirillum sp.]|nr:hypothetical protein [Magnetospirillum sp.]